MPLPFEPGPLFGIAAAVFTASVARGFTGFGFTLAAVPLLGFLLPPSQTVPLAVMLQFCVSLVDLPRARKTCHWPSLRWLIAGTLVGSPVGVAALAAASPAVSRLGVALVCGGGTIALLCGLRFGTSPRTWQTVAVGLVAGLCNGLAAMPGPPVVAYFLATPLAAWQVRPSLLMFFLATSIASAVSLFGAGLIDRALLFPMLLGLPFVILGNWVGERLLRFGTSRRHRSVSIALLAGVALLSAGQALSDLLGHPP